MTYIYVDPTRWNQEPDHYEQQMHCKKCGWYIYADLEDHYWEDRRDHRIPERWQHKDCYERQNRSRPYRPSATPRQK